MWVTPADVIVDLGSSAAPDVDDPRLIMCTDAANAWAFRKRFEAGYVDDADIVPDASVKLGTVRAAVVWYRNRGAADSFTSFDELAGFTPTGIMGEINRLLGIGRGRVDNPPADAAVTPLRRRVWVP